MDLLFTTDQRIRYRQNLGGRKIAIVVLTGTTKWSRVRLHLERIADVVDATASGSYTEIPIPLTKLPPVYLYTKRGRNFSQHCGPLKNCTPHTAGGGFPTF